MTDTLRDRNPLELRVADFIHEHCPIPHSTCLLVAVSGGPDSVCLLDILASLRQEMGLKLHIAHLDHQLRGVESEADAHYVAEIAEKRGIPATIAKRDVNAYRAEHRVSLEEAAREVRYNFFTETALEVGAAQVAIGHTEDDHIETILMHLIRGSGTRGVGGLMPVTTWRYAGDELNVIRPLLTVSRKETQSYCREQKLNPRLDSSNLSLSPLRNRVRLKLLPQLKSYNPKIKEALLRTATISADDTAYLEAEGRRQWRKTAREQENTVIIDKGKFLKLPPALKRQVLRVSMEKLAGSLKDIEARHIEAMMCALDKPAGRSLNLPDGLIFTIDYDRYLIGRSPSKLSPYPTIDREVKLTIPGTTKLPGWRVEASVTDPTAVVKNADDFTAFLDFDKTGDKLSVRSRCPGDRFYPLGMDQEKRLNRFMIDAKVPRLWRQRIPIVSAEKQIVWAVGLRIDERVKVTDTTREVLYLRFKQG